MTNKCSWVNPESCAAYNGKTHFCEYVPWCVHKISVNCVTPQVTYQLSTGKQVALTAEEHTELLAIIGSRPDGTLC